MRSRRPSPRTNLSSGPGSSLEVRSTAETWLGSETRWARSGHSMSDPHFDMPPRTTNCAFAGFDQELDSCTRRTWSCGMKIGEGETIWLRCGLATPEAKERSMQSTSFVETRSSPDTWSRICCTDRVDGRRRCFADRRPTSATCPRKSDGCSLGSCTAFTTQSQELSVVAGQRPTHVRGEEREIGRLRCGPARRRRCCGGTERSSTPFRLTLGRGGAP